MIYYCLYFIKKIHFGVLGCYIVVSEHVGPVRPSPNYFNPLGCDKYVNTFWYSF